MLILVEESPNEDNTEELNGFQRPGKEGDPPFLDSNFLSEWHIFFPAPGGWNDGFRRELGNRCQSLTLGNEISYSVKILNRTREASLAVSQLNRCRGPMRTAGRKRPFQIQVWMYLGKGRRGESALLPLLPPEHCGF